MTLVSTFLRYTAVTPPTGKLVAVVIDVLRATTSICVALDAGAAGIIPVSSEKSAQHKVKDLLFEGANIVMGGERGGFKIPGFHFGNSPVEYSEAEILGKTVVFLTTNGTAAIAEMDAADSLYVSGFVNVSAMGEELARIGIPVAIVCSGSNGLPCFEDTLCAGALVYEIRKSGVFSFDDTSLIAADLYDRNRGDIEVVLREKCVHGRYLTSIGFGEDVEYASRSNLFDFTVKLKRGVLVKDYAKS